MTRIDETQHRLLAWTNGQHSERLAAQVLLEEGYVDLDPSHPYGGPDGGRDGICSRDGRRWVMAVYFPRGQVTYNDTEKKLLSDIESAAKHSPYGVVFVTNQELKLADRQKLRDVDDSVEIEIFHMERVAQILDKPSMHAVRKRYLDIDADKIPLSVTFIVNGAAHALTDPDTLLDKLCEIEENGIRERAAKSRVNRLRSAFPMPALPGAPADPGPITPEQEERLVEAMRATAQAKRTRGLDYLAARAFAGVQFAVANTEPVFLTRVRVTATFHDAYGLEPMDAGPNLPDKVRDPDYVAPSAGLFSAPTLDIGGLRFDNNPVHFENFGDDLQVTIDLDTLRPPPDRGFVGKSSDVIVVARNPDDPVKVSWFVTAESYGTPQQGDPFELSTEPEDARQSLVRTLQRDEE
ncbi:hypothetical protein [Gordonia hongkongensis]|uniref:hypothetical protein n=1 Tax=Gordonia hongkongensis TaxID=1701090 RepID=UPI003D7372A6